MITGFRRLRRLDKRGFGLLELLIATAIGCVLLGVLLQFAVSAQTSAGVQSEIADLHQRLRVAVDAMRHDITLAGAGPARGPGRGPLTRLFPPIMAARIGATGADPELSFRSDRISVLYIPDGAAQTKLAGDMTSPASPVAIDGTLPGCRPASACDFTAGADVLIYEPVGAGGAHEVFTVTSADAATNTLTPSAQLSRSYSAQARVAIVVQRTYYLDSSGKRLMVYDGGRSDVPLVDHVVSLRFAYYADPRPGAVPPPAPGEPNCAYTGSPPVSLLTNLGGDAPKMLTPGLLTDGPVCGQAPYRFDADLLRVRRVSVTIRLEAESAEFRGRGSAFATPGLSRGGVRFVPDLETRIEVTPRNMAR
jgi:prepilin-type N-terminal cleavage/methylation domain-containing protein